MTVTWQAWWPKPDVPTMQVQFTGFGPGGNGYAMLDELHNRGVIAMRDGDDIRLHAGERDDTRAEPGYWFCEEVDSDRAVYPIRPAVHDAKYEQRQEVGR